MFLTWSVVGFIKDSFALLSVLALQTARVILLGLQYLKLGSLIRLQDYDDREFHHLTWTRRECVAGEKGRIPK